MHSTGFGPSLENVDFGNGLFVTSQQLASNLYYSNTALTGSWTQNPLSGGITSLHVKYGNSQWVSSDGASRIEVFSADMQQSIYNNNAVAFGSNSLFFVDGYFYHGSVGGTGNLYRSATAKDTNWQVLSTNCPAINSIAALDCKARTCVVVGQNTSNNTAMCVSTTGVNGSYANITPFNSNVSYDTVELLSTENRLQWFF